MRQNTRRVLRQGAIAVRLCSDVAGVRLLGRPMSGPTGGSPGAFVCRADFSLADYEPLLGELADLQEELVRVLGIAPAEERIELYLFRSEADYRNYLTAYFPEVPFRCALYIKRGGPGVVLTFRSGQLATDLRHECTRCAAPRGPADGSSGSMKGLRSSSRCRRSALSAIPICQKSVERSIRNQNSDCET